MAGGSYYTPPSSAQSLSNTSRILKDNKDYFLNAYILYYTPYYRELLTETLKKHSSQLLLIKENYFDGRTHPEVDNFAVAFPLSPSQRVA